MINSNFNPIEDIEVLAQTENMCMVSTFYLLETLNFMQKCGWRLYELLPDDIDWMEHNVLTLYKKKSWK